MNQSPEDISTPEEVENNKGLQKKLRREERKGQREQAAKKEEQQKQIKKILLWAIPLVVIGLAGWAIVRSPRTPDADDPLISRRGIHWHPNLSITIKGEPVTIPANIGIGGIHADTHTHKENDQIHLEMSRPVRESDTRLAKFFETWGKEFNSQCIFDVCNGEEGTVKMFVNGQENTEFENYPMQDKDRIEIRYE